jgi:hypothetical protein
VSYVCDVTGASPTTDRSARADFRRRFPLELSPAEYARLDKAGRRTGSKRAALLAGLAALAELAKVRADTARVAEEHFAAKATITGLTARVVELERALAGEHRRVISSAVRARKTIEVARLAIAKATDDARAAGRLRESEHEARVNVQSAFHALEVLFIHELQCPRCGKFAPSGEWGSHSTSGWDIVYHRSCGFHEGDVLEQTSVLGRRRGRSGPAAPMRGMP